MKIILRLSGPWEGLPVPETRVFARLRRIAFMVAALLCGMLVMLLLGLLLGGGSP